MRVALGLLLMATIAMGQMTREAAIAELKALKNGIGSLGRQLMMQQLFVEERIRSDGDSGIKQIRHSTEGTKSYHSDTYTGSGVCGVHEHSNYDRTVGMGEFIAVLNGVEFRTRHNDYKLVMPHRTSKTLHAIEPVPFPEVPPAVLNKKTIDEQIVEMREWFKAWKNQDYKTRDYRKYFKPVLCYLEGAWMNSDVNGKVEESFSSDRHHIDASNWHDLQDKIRFTSYSGRKSNLENFAYLPTTIMEMTNGTIPKLAQWNYRILCHPLKNDLPLNRFRVVDDLHSRMSYKRSMAQHATSRTARFQINPSNRATWGSEHYQRRGFLDDLMEQIPGKDNYPGKLQDDAFGLVSMDLARTNSKPVNTAYYNRWFKVLKRGAMGLSLRHRGYADENIFMAMTTQPKVAGLTIKDCQRVKGQRQKVCKDYPQKWTYAIPLEIIYMTPLSKWNPYNLPFKGSSYRDPNTRTVYQGPTKGTYRNGRPGKDTAYNGTNFAVFYRTPSEFFTGNLAGKTPADTTRGAVSVLDSKGVERAVSPSGTRLFTPNIPGVGRMRMRYPIMPVHNEGSVIWKEIEALKDLVMEQSKYLYMYREVPLAASNMKAVENTDLILKTSVGTKDSPGPHRHRVRLSVDDVKDLKAGKTVVVTSSLDRSHTHTLEVAYNKKRGYFFKSCDNSGIRCWDGHVAKLDLDKTP